MMRSMLFSLVVCLVWAAPALAQDDDPATLRVVGAASVEVPPDHARLSVGVRIQADSPEGAATEMSRRIDAIVDALVILGFDRDSIPTQVFGISADRDRMGGNVITGYSSATTLQITTFELDRIPEFLSAAVEAGATEVGNVDFRSTRQREARSRALELAVAAARDDAEVLARAAGVELGDLLEVTNFAQPSGGIMLRGASPAAGRLTTITGSAITPQLLEVNAQVVATWRVR